MIQIIVLAFALLATSSVADEFKNVDIDWSTVKPIVYYPKFWDNKSPELRPPSSFFEKYDRQLQTGGRIVGGQVAQPHQFPYQAAVLTFIPSIGGQALCGGSYIGRQSVLTAAHCVEDGTSGTVVLGAHFLTNQNEPNQRRIAFGAHHIIMHPGWNPALIQNDVAIVRLESPPPPVPGAIRAAILPSLADINYDFAGEDGVASGWGVHDAANPVASDVLRHVYDNIITPTACAISSIGIATASNICMTGTQNRGVCNGDSGGPLTVRRGGESMHVGIASFVIVGCHNTLPSVFVRTTSFLPWITDNTV